MAYLGSDFFMTTHAADIDVVDGRMSRHGVINGLRPEAEGAQKEAHDKGENGPEEPVAIGWQVDEAEYNGGVKEPDFIHEPSAEKDFLGQTAGQRQEEYFFFAAVNEPESDVACAALNGPRIFERDLRDNMSKAYQGQANYRVPKPIFSGIGQRLELKMAFAPAPHSETEAGQPKDSINKTGCSNHGKLPLTIRSR